VGEFLEHEAELAEAAEHVFVFVIKFEFIALHVCREHRREHLLRLDEVLVN